MKPFDPDKDSEKRKHSRIVTPYVIHCLRTDFEEDGGRSTGLVYDLSPEGLLFLSEEKYLPDQRLTLEIELPRPKDFEPEPDAPRGLLGTYPVTAKAKVVRMQALGGMYFTGAIFLEMSPVDRKTLAYASSLNQ